MVWSPQLLLARLNTKGGISEDSKYFVFITPPKIMSLSGGILENFPGDFTDIVSAAASIYEVFSLGIAAERVNLPGKQFMTTPHIMYGTRVKLPYGIMYDPLSISFICTNKMSERKFFDQWHRLITDPTNNYWNYYDDYVTDIWIAKLPPGLPSIAEGIEIVAGAIFGGALGAEEAAQLYLLQVQEAYPIAISSQEMSYDGDSYLTLNVEFSYRRWLSLNDMAATNLGGIPGTADGNFLGGKRPTTPPEAGGAVDPNNLPNPTKAKKGTDFS